MRVSPFFILHFFAFLQPTFSSFPIFAAPSRACPMFSKYPCPDPVSPANQKNHSRGPNCKGYVLDRVDVGLVASEGLDTATGSEIPDFCSRIASSRDKESLVRRESQTVGCFRCSIQNKSRRRRTGPIAINERERENNVSKVEG